MGQTATQKILAKHAGLNSVKAGDLITCNLDLVLGNDITSPVAINEMKKAGSKVFDPSKIVLVLDHFVPCKDIQSAQQCKQVREFAKEQNISNLFDVGNMGIEHVILPEKGFVKPASLIIGADSHTCTYGALGCFSTGIGSTDMAMGMLLGKCWFKVPSGIKITLKGSFQKYVTGKDLILHIIGLLGVDGATYKSLEFYGDMHSLSIDDRLTICNMAIECGAKNAFMPIDSISEKYLISVGIEKDYIDANIVTADSDCEYSSELNIDLSTLKPTVAFPHLPSNTRTFDEIDSKIAIDQVIIGSCTNGRLSDLRQSAEVMKGKKVADGVRCIIIPGSMQVYKQAMNEGLFDIFIDAGAIISTPTCGPCLGGHMGILADDEVAVSTTNRNFVGRMGHISSKIYLSSPYVAGMSAIKGYLASPSE